MLLVLAIVNRVDLDSLRRIDGAVRMNCAMVKRFEKEAGRGCYG